MVRSGASLTSQQDGQRLANGAVIRQIQIARGRVHYELVRGEGPKTGWVSCSLQGKDLLARHWPSSEDKDTSGTVQAALLRSEAHAKGHEGT